MCGRVDKLVCMSTCVRVGYNVVWVLGWSGGYIIVLQMLQIFTMLSACSTTCWQTNLLSLLKRFVVHSSNVLRVFQLLVYTYQLSKDVFPKT